MTKWTFLFSFVFLFAACGGKQLSSNSSDTSGSDSTALPVFFCEDYIHHLDTFSFSANPQVSTTFVFSNTGTKPLVIDSVETSCGCTSATFPHTSVLPGDSGIINVTYHGRGMTNGFFEYSIILYTNTRFGEEFLLIDGTRVD